MCELPIDTLPHFQRNRSRRELVPQSQAYLLGMCEPTNPGNTLQKQSCVWGYREVMPMTRFAECTKPESRPRAAFDATAVLHPVGAALMTFSLGTSAVESALRR